ncbi:MAG TPA: NADP-dependent oxidoreductase [Acidimicrobiia bacterium]|nr:NADP-dependent oxidoreductase [Acidimicrobiia bacterium]
MSPANRQVRLRQRPVGLVDDATFEVVEEPLADLAPGEYRVRIAYLSIDPTNRVWIREEPSYLPPVRLGEVMRGGAVGEVVESRNDDYPVGAPVLGMLGWQEYATCGPDVTARVVPSGIPLPHLLGVYGTTGITAYFGMLDVAQPQPGDTAVVSGAAGATGSVAGQIAKIQGARVIGIAGTPEKCDWLTGELGFDAAVNYRTEDVGRRLHELAPEGIDVFFDNVGGATLDTVLTQLAIGARVALCGAISTYNESDRPAPIHSYMNLVVKRARMQGFLVLDYLDRFPEAVLQLVAWVEEGRIRWRDHIVDGLHQAPRALNMLFTGENTGKLMVRVGPDPSG